MTDAARSPQGAAAPGPPSGLTPPSGGATAPDPREVEIRAAADALAEALARVSGRLADHAGMTFPDCCPNCDALLAAGVALSAYRKIVALASARSAAAEDPRERAAPPREASGGADIREAAQKVLAGFDAGVFVRDVSHDGEPGWALNLLPAIAALGRLAALVNDAPTSPVAGVPEGMDA